VTLEQTVTRWVVVGIAYVIACIILWKLEVIL